MNKRQGVLSTVFFVLYILIGGLVFMKIENEAILDSGAPNANEELKMLHKIRDKLLETNPLNLSKVTYDQVNQHVSVVIEKYDAGQNITVPPELISFEDAIFFCLVTITTIGYGNVTPQTSGGRCFIVFYAIVGVPFTGILLAALGDFFSTKLVQAHEKTKSKHYDNRVALIVNTILYLVPGFVFFIFLPAGLFMVLEEWEFVDGFYYSFITLMTIGYGDFVAGNSLYYYGWLYKVGLMIWIIFGLGYLSMILNFIAKAMKSKQLRNIEKSVAHSLKQTQVIVGKEVDLFVKTMNEFYENKIKQKGSNSKLSRSSSCPSLSEETGSKFAAAAAAAAAALGENGEPNERSVNLIMDLAMALASCNQEDATSNDATLKSGDNPINNRRKSFAHQLLQLALIPPSYISPDPKTSSTPPSPKHRHSDSALSLQEMLSKFDSIRHNSCMYPYYREQNSSSGGGGAGVGGNIPSIRISNQEDQASDGSNELNEAVAIRQRRAMSLSTVDNTLGRKPAAELMLNPASLSVEITPTTPNMRTNARNLEAILDAESDSVTKAEIVDETRTSRL